MLPTLGQQNVQSGLNPPPPVKGGTGVFFNRHGSLKPPVLERRKTLWWARLSRRTSGAKRPKMGVSFETSIRAFLGSLKSQKNDPGLIFRGLGGGPKNGAPSRAPKSVILL